MPLILCVPASFSRNARHLRVVVGPTALRSPRVADLALTLALLHLQDRTERPDANRRRPGLRLRLAYDMVGVARVKQRFVPVEVDGLGRQRIRIAREQSGRRFDARVCSPTWRKLADL